MGDKAAYLEQFKALMPPGEAWRTETGSALSALLSVFAAEFAKIDARALDLLNEADPRSTLELLTEWEKAVGLPDPCIGTPTNLNERRALVHQRLTSRGGQSVAFFSEIAEKLGYDIRIDEHRPFTCGLSECGGTDQCGEPEIRFWWHVAVLGAKVVWFECGVSICPDPMAKLEIGAELICIFTRLKPAHTHLTFGVEEAA